MTAVYLLATGPELLGRQFLAIEPAIEKLISEARREIEVAVYLISEQALPVLDQLERALRRGVKVTLVANRLNEQPPIVRRRLLSMSSNFANFNLYDFKDPLGRHLHAKVLVADRRKAIVGSANLSWGGLVANYELAVLLEGEPAWQLAEIIDLIAQKSNRIESSSRPL